jgi:hypothetical protein
MEKLYALKRPRIALTSFVSLGGDKRATGRPVSALGPFASDSRCRP